MWFVKIKMQSNANEKDHHSTASNRSYSITLPLLPTTVYKGANTMTVDNWTSDIASGTTDANGDSHFCIGGTLHVNANQGNGRYSGSFQVVAAYN